MGDKEYDTDTVAALFGTAEDGHSVCVMVKDFEPYFDLSMDDGWVDEHFDKIARYFSRTKDPLRYKTYRGPRVFGYVPDADGQPKVSTWLRLHFPTMGALRSVMRSIDRDRKGVLRKIFPTIDPETDVHLRFVFELAGHQNSIEQMFLAYTNLVPSGWVTVESPVPHSADATTCQWEVQAPVRALRPDDSAAIAPCLTLSFDIECVPEKTRNMPQAYRHQDFVVQIGVSLEVFGGEKRHGVICLGDTGPVENVAILSCPTEFQLLEAFRDLVVATDPDMITGYNIYKFDFFYMSQRVQRYEIFREKSPAELLAIRKGLQEYTKEEKEESVIAAAFQGRRPKKVSKAQARSRKIEALRKAWPPWRNKQWRDYMDVKDPEEMDLFLETGDTDEEFLEAVAFFAEKAQPTTFWQCSRLKNEVCELRRVILESSAMGQNELFRFDMTGRVVFDLYLHCKNNMKMGTYRLDDVAKKFVGDQKIDLPYVEMFHLYKTGKPEDKATVAEYCSKDCDLVLRIIQNAGIFTDNIEHSRVTYTPLTWLVTRGQQVRVFSQIGRFCERLSIAMNHVFVKPPDTYVGATVIEPKKGYYQHPIATLDFASLYPSIMQAHNLCFSTIVFRKDYAKVRALEAQGKIRVERVTASNEVHWFVQEVTYKGVLPRLLHDLLTARRSVKKVMKKEKDPFKHQLLNSKQLALKISCNSVYGFCGSRTGKMGCWPIAASTTTIGRGMIDDTKAAVETKYGAEVVYGDTVSRHHATCMHNRSPLTYSLSTALSRTRSWYDSKRRSRRKKGCGCRGSWPRRPRTT